MEDMMSAVTQQAYQQASTALAGPEQTWRATELALDAAIRSGGDASFAYRAEARAWDAYEKVCRQAEICLRPGCLNPITPATKHCHIHRVR